MYKRVLIPLDGSQLAEGALAHGVAIAQAFGAELLLLRVIPAREPVAVPRGVREWAAVEGGHGGEVQQTEGMLRQEAEDYLGTVAHRLRSEGARVEIETRRGHAAACILDALPERDVDLVVMSTHGRGGLARLAFGSVADYVIRKSGRPVLVVRPEH